MYGDVFGICKKGYGEKDLPPRFVVWRTKKFFTIKDLDTRYEIALVNDWKKIKPLQEVLTSYIYSNHVRSSEVQQLVLRLGIEDPTSRAKWVPTPPVYMMHCHDLVPLYLYRSVDMMRQGLSVLPEQSLGGLFREIQSCVDAVGDKDVPGLSYDGYYIHPIIWGAEVFPEYEKYDKPTLNIAANFRLDFHIPPKGDEVAERLSKLFEQSKFAALSHAKDVVLFKAGPKSYRLRWGSKIHNIPDLTRDVVRDMDNMVICFGTWHPLHREKIPKRW